MGCRCIVTCVTSPSPGESLRSHEHEARPPTGTLASASSSGCRPVTADRPPGLDSPDRAGAPPSRLAVRPGLRHPDGVESGRARGAGGVRPAVVCRRAVRDAALAVELAPRDGERPRARRAHVAGTEILTILSRSEENE